LEDLIIAITNHLHCS